MVEIRKKVDESWKDQVAQEKKQRESGGLLRPDGTPAAPPEPAPESAAPPVDAAQSPDEASPESGMPEARFDVFVSSLAMEALIALGDIPHPATGKKMAPNVPHARYLIDTLGMLEEKTRGNVSADEAKLLKDALYQLRMRYMAKAGG